MMISCKAFFQRCKTHESLDSYTEKNAFPSKIELPAKQLKNLFCQWLQIVVKCSQSHDKAPPRVRHLSCEDQSNADDLDEVGDKKYDDF